MGIFSPVQVVIKDEWRKNKIAIRLYEAVITLIEPDKTQWWFYNEASPKKRFWIINWVVCVRRNDEIIMLKQLAL